MKIQLEKVDFSESIYHRGNKLWKAKTLYEFAEQEKYPVLDLPLWAIDLTNAPFECVNLITFIDHLKRVYDCSLDYPIILDDCGQIADGNHRVCKAIVEGKETIKAIRLLKMPEPDKIED